MLLQGNSIWSEANLVLDVYKRQLYAGFLFIGIFLSILFVMATILILYYKQISEGFEDKKRFEIMQKVGLDHREVRRIIHAQVLMVFFLPLAVAGIHIVFAFPIVNKQMCIRDRLLIQ